MQKTINTISYQSIIDNCLTISLICLFCSQVNANPVSGEYNGDNIAKVSAMSQKRRFVSWETKEAGENANKFYSMGEQKEKAGKLNEAKGLYYRAAITRASVWGEGDPAVAKICFKIGLIENKQGHIAQARSWFKQNLSALSKHYGSGDFELVPALSQLAELETKEKNHEAASSYYAHVLALQERKFGEENKRCCPTRLDLARELILAKDMQGAEQVLNNAMALAEKTGDTNSLSYDKLKQLLGLVQAARANTSSK